KRNTTYNTEDSPVDTHLSTNSAVSSLSRAERTGCQAFYCVWSYVLHNGRILVYDGDVDVSHHLRKTTKGSLLKMRKLHTQKGTLNREYTSKKYYSKRKWCLSIMLYFEHPQPVPIPACQNVMLNHLQIPYNSDCNLPSKTLT
ncbi:hypothetical protein B0T21DRAFT_299269, partial [Apiosordaria backusii]